MSRLAVAVARLQANIAQQRRSSEVKEWQQEHERAAHWVRQNRVADCHPKPHSGYATRCSALSRSTNQESPYRDRCTSQLPRSAKPCGRRCREEMSEEAEAGEKAPNLQSDGLELSERPGDLHRWNVRILVFFGPCRS